MDMQKVVFDQPLPMITQIGKYMQVATRKTIPLENRRWFQIAIALTAYCVAAAMGYLVSQPLASSAETVRLVLILLTTWAGLGLSRLLTMFVPLLLVKLWPQLDE